MTAPAVDRPAVAFRPAGGLPLIAASEDSQRWVKARVGLAVGLLVLNVVTFYPKPGAASRCSSRSRPPWASC